MDKHLFIYIQRKLDLCNKMLNCRAISFDCKLQVMMYKQELINKRDRELEKDSIVL